jgi:hypothetical protein
LRIRAAPVLTGILEKQHQNFIYTVSASVFCCFFIINVLSLHVLSLPERHKFLGLRALLHAEEAVATP